MLSTFFSWCLTWKSHIMLQLSHKCHTFCHFLPLLPFFLASLRTTPDDCFYACKQLSLWYYRSDTSLFVGLYQSQVDVCSIQSVLNFQNGIERFLSWRLNAYFFHLVLKKMPYIVFFKIKIKEMTIRHWKGYFYCGVQSNSGVQKSGWWLYLIC